MKIQIFTGKNICIMAILLFLFGFHAISVAQPLLQPVIEVEVNAAQDALEIVNTQNTNFCSVSGYGSICVPRNRTARIRFRLAGNNACNREKGFQWELHRVVLGGEESDTKPANPDGWGNLSLEVANDFSANQVTGVVTGVHPTNETVISVWDQNSYQVNLWYKIEAICKERGGDDVEGDPIYLDPRMRNGGMD